MSDPVSFLDTSSIDTVWNNLATHTTYYLSKLATTFYIVGIETYANLRYVLPFSLTWIWRRYVTQEITYFSIQVTMRNVTRVAYLYIHDTLSQNQQTAKPILFAHGDYGLPSTLLHFADQAAEKRAFVFSLYVPCIHDNTEHDINIALHKEAIDKIESLLEKKFSGILGVGHSKGAIFLAHRQFVNLDPRIKATFLVGARLYAPDESSCPNVSLRNLVRTIYQGIINYPIREDTCGCRPCCLAGKSGALRKKSGPGEEQGQ